MNECKKETINEWTNERTNKDRRMRSKNSNKTTAQTKNVHNCCRLWSICHLKMIWFMRIDRFWICPQYLRKSIFIRFIAISNFAHWHVVLYVCVFFLFLLFILFEAQIHWWTILVLLLSFAYFIICFFFQFITIIIHHTSESKFSDIFKFVRNENWGKWKNETTKSSLTSSIKYVYFV